MKKIKSSSKYIKSVIAFDWWKYLLLFLVSSILIYYAFYLKLSLKRYEEIRIFTTAEVVDERIIDELEDYLKDDGILEVTIYNADANSSYYDIQLETNGFGNGDILILPSSKTLDNEYLVQNSLLFNDKLISEFKEINPHIEFLQYETYTYAIKIYDINDETYNESLHFDEWVKLEETYYMMFVRNSPNLGEYGDKSENNHVSALKAAKYLLG